MRKGGREKGGEMRKGGREKANEGMKGKIERERESHQQRVMVAIQVLFFLANMIFLGEREDTKLMELK